MARVYTGVIAVGVREERPDTRNVKEVQLTEPDNWFICEMVVGMVDITEELIMFYHLSLWTWRQGWTYDGNLETKHLV